MFPAASPEALSPPRAAPAGLARSDVAMGLVFVLAYAILETALFANHIPWRDEVQAWLVARSLAQPLDFLIIPAEGHPPLWFWILRGLSGFATLDQARYLTLAIALLNAVLFWRLVGRQLLLLVLLLCSSVIVLQWGYHFRPYCIVLTTVLAALLLDRHGRKRAATWVLAIGCGFHFFTGFLFAFWLIWQWRGGMPLSRLLGPSVLAALFGISALVSGRDNPEASSSLAHLVPGLVDNLSWWMPGTQFHHPAASAGYLILLVIGLWRSPFILGALLSMTLAFAVATAIVYGEYQWHAAFMMVMAIMAFLLAGDRARLWALMIILAPHALMGISNAKNALIEKPSGDIDIYRIVQADAGMEVLPPQQLVGWPDYMVASAAARLDFTYRSGNNGTILGPVDWRIRSRWMIDPGLATLATPYWLVCKDCASVLEFIAGAGLQVTGIGSAVNYSDGRIYAYRIDAGI